jgi:aryl-alcohol dehydrogenase-like predicted oxidoreductase
MASIGLGTVQLGLPYGNRVGQELLSQTEANNILTSALAEGVRFFDTAIAYGESEARLGHFNLAAKGSDVIISTKIPVVEPRIYNNPNVYYEWVTGQSSASLARLQMPRHKLLQFHQCDLEFLESSAVQSVFKRLIDEEITGEVGISVYDAAQAKAALETGFVSWLQVPANLIDVRFLSPDFLARARSKGAKLIVRSAFLQGVLVQDAAVPKVKKAPELLKLRRMCQDAIEESGLSISLQEASLSLLFGNYGDALNFVLIGVDSEEALRQNFKLIREKTAPIPQKLLDKLSAARQYADELGLFNPGSWNV